VTKKAKKRSKKRAGGPVRLPAANASSSEEPGLPLASFFSEAWSASRHGAISARGYRYQDGVGSWLSIRMHVGELACERVVPEGLEDVSCEGDDAWDVQVKSRQARVGDFPANIAGGHVVDAWTRFAKRRDRRPKTRLAVIFERPVGGVALQSWARPLGEEPAWAGLVAEVRRLAGREGISDDEVDALLRVTTVIVLPWRALEAEAAAWLAGASGLPAGAAVAVVRAVQDALGECANRNAQVGWDDRAGLSRTDLARLSEETVALVDRDALEEAVTSGSCEVVDFDTPAASGAFYEGESTQPGHVAAGLVVARPQPTDAVLAGLDTRRAVLVAGPSGIGKSAVVWMAAYVSRHIVWYRVNRLGDEDVEPLMRLARAAGAGRFATVGFVVDGVGTGALRAWDALRTAVAVQPGTVLLGSVREEDTLPLATLGDCAVVRPRLDEDLAERIYAELHVRGSTAREHWREAYERSDGLTLEYTHLLTQGRRLQDVVSDQIRTRVRERRDAELAAVAPVAMAHQWGASLNLARLRHALGSSDADLRSALARLAAEHLVTFDGEVVRGLHQLRSSAVTASVHEVPPPSPGSTARVVVEAADPADLRVFLGGALGRDTRLAEPVLTALAESLGRGSSEPGRVAAALDGLRLADFVAAALRWTEVVEQFEVPAPLRPVTFNLALLSTGDVGEWADSRVRSAANAITADPAWSASALRDDLLERLGRHRLTETLAACGDLNVATELLGSMAGSGLDVPPSTGPDSPLSVALDGASAQDLAPIVQAAAAVSPPLGAAFVELVGGKEAVLAAMRDGDAWILDLAIEEDDGERVLRGQRLHASDRLDPDPDGTIRALADVGLSCFPSVDRADLHTVAAGGVPITVGSYGEFAATGLLRQYVHGPAEVAWNRARLSAAVSLVAEPSDTERLAAGRAVLDRTAAFIADLAAVWIAIGRKADVDRLNKARSALLAQIDALKPPSPSAEHPIPNDPIHSVAHGLVQNLPPRLEANDGYASLAAFTGDTLRKQVDEVHGLRWSILGLEAAPPSVATIRGALRDLHAVLAELAWGDGAEMPVVAAARQAQPHRALAQAARVARSRAEARFDGTLTTLRALAEAAGVRAHAFKRSDQDIAAAAWPPYDTCLVVDLDRIDEWQVALSAMPGIVDSIAVPASSVTVIAARNGKTLPRFSATVFKGGNVYQLPTAAEPWVGIVPPAHATPFTDSVVEAHQSLEELSAIAYRLTLGDLGEILDDAIESAAGRLDTATKHLLSLPADPVTSEISGLIAQLAARVNGELEGQVSRPFLAEALAKGVLNEPTDEIGIAMGMIAFATEWDLDPSTAIAWLSDIA
jgi:hypothetical protein